MNDQLIRTSNNADVVVPNAVVADLSVEADARGTVFNLVRVTEVVSAQNPCPGDPDRVACDPLALHPPHKFDANLIAENLIRLGIADKAKSLTQFRDVGNDASLIIVDTIIAQCSRRFVEYSGHGTVDLVVSNQSVKRGTDCQADAMTEYFVGCDLAS